MPKEVQVIYPRGPGIIVAGGHRFEAVRVSHATLTWGYLVDFALAYFSDYSSLRGVLPALRRTRIVVLDGSGWQRTFPSHLPNRGRGQLVGLILGSVSERVLHGSRTPVLIMR